MGFVPEMVIERELEFLAVITKFLHLMTAEQRKNFLLDALGK